MRQGSQEEQKLTLLIMGDDINGAITYAKCMNLKNIQHLFNARCCVQRQGFFNFFEGGL